MRIIKRVDSPRAARWLRRAETLVRSLRLEYQSKHEIQDGYLLEGKRAGNIRIAKVMDLPGRFISYGIGIESLYYSYLPDPNNVFNFEWEWVPEALLPSRIGAPPRVTTLEMGPPEEGVPERVMEFDRAEPSDKPVVVLGYSDPPTSVRSLNMSAPSASPGWVVQTRAVQPATDPRETSGFLDRYKDVSSVWIMVDAWGVGNNPDMTFLIDNQVFTTLLGSPALAVSDWVDYFGRYTRGSECRSWATVVNKDKVAIFSLLVSGYPDGPINDLGVLVVERIEGRWGVTYAQRIDHADMPHPLFVPGRLRRIPDRPDAVAQNPSRSMLSLKSPAVASDGESMYLTSSICHTVGIQYMYDGVLREGDTSITGVIRIRIDPTGFGGYTHTVEITDVNSNLSHNHPELGLDVAPGSTPSLAGLATVWGTGVVVSNHIDYPWGEGEWVSYCGLVFDGKVLRELVGFSRGSRITSVQLVPEVFPYYYSISPVYVDPCERLQERTLEKDDDGNEVVHTQSQYIMGAALQLQVSPGSQFTPNTPHGNQTEGQLNRPDMGGIMAYPMAYIGEGSYELTMYPYGTSGSEWDMTSRRIGRIDMNTGELGWVPIPESVLDAVSTCYAAAYYIETPDGEEVLVPHRSVVAYATVGRSGEYYGMTLPNTAYTIEIREGDEVIAIAHDVEEDCENGVYYIGNPFARMRYGQMGVEV